MKVVAFVPIKLNSQRLPHKNILELGNKPLCSYVLDTLCSVKEIAETFVYCSDEIIQKYIPNTVTFLKRNKELDRDEVKGEQIYRSFINEVDADIYLLAHTTSPFIKKESIDHALKKVISGEYDSAFSVECTRTFVWYQEKPLNYRLENVPRTQDIEPIFVETSAFYIFKKDIFIEHNRRIGFRPFLQITNGKENIDIDEAADFEFAKRWID